MSSAGATPTPTNTPVTTTSTGSDASAKTPAYPRLAARAAPSSEPRERAMATSRTVHTMIPTPATIAKLTSVAMTLTSDAIPATPDECASSTAMAVVD
jgi:hypothetical protein